MQCGFVVHHDFGARHGQIDADVKLALDRNHRQFADGYRRCSDLHFHGQEGSLPQHQKPRAKFGQPNRFSVVKPEDFPIPVDHSPDPQIAVDGAVSFARALECHGLFFTLLHVDRKITSRKSYAAPGVARLAAGDLTILASSREKRVTNGE